MSIHALAATATTPGAAILDATSDYVPQMVIVGAGGVTAGAVFLAWKRGWGFFKGLAR